MAELLVVVAITTALSAILFPVFSQAKREALRSSCTSNLRQIYTGSTLYMADYDDRIMPLAYQVQTVATSRNDRTWVQMLLPYVKSFQVFKCPADNSIELAGDSTYDQDLVPGDIDSRYYTASKHVDYGYNYQYFSPTDLSVANATPSPKFWSQVGSTSNAIMFVDSVWGRDDKGDPYGGGTWLVVPPCRFYQDPMTRQKVDSFTDKAGVTVPVYTTSKGWLLNDPTSPDQYGGTWAWHSGRSNVLFADGSVRSYTPKGLSTNCDVRPNWGGLFSDRSAYLWDIG